MNNCGAHGDRSILNSLASVKITKALAGETRLRIFEAISATAHRNGGEIVSMRGGTPTTVSHYLKILSEARLIVCRRQGQFVYSEAVPETIVAYTRAPRESRTARKPDDAADSRISVGKGLLGISNTPEP